MLPEQSSVPSILDILYFVPSRFITVFHVCSFNRQQRRTHGEQGVRPLRLHANNGLRRRRPGFDRVPTQLLPIGDGFSQENVNQSIKMEAAIGQVGDGFWGSDLQVDVYPTLALS